MVFSDKCKVYKAKLADFETTKASAMGEFLAPKLGFDSDEKPVMMQIIPENVMGHNIVFIFENGKGVRVPVSAYETKANRRRLTGAYSAASPVAGIVYEAGESIDLYITDTSGRGITIKSSLIPEKATRTASGVTVFTLKKGRTVQSVVAGADLEKYPDSAKCRKIKIPAVGVATSATKDSD